MQDKTLSLGVILTATVMTVFPAVAQQRTPAPRGGGPQMGGPDGGGRAAPAEAMGKAVVAVATNNLVISELGLTPEQVALLKAGLDVAKVQEALAAQRLAETVAAVLTDPAVAMDLKLTAAQKLLIREKMTAALVHKALTPQQIEELARATGVGMARAAMDAMRQRMMQYDKDGDGQLSEAERREAFQELGNRRRGAPGDRGGTN